MHSPIKVKVEDVDEKGEFFHHIIETTVGRILFNEHVPRGVGYINQLLTKKSLSGYYFCCIQGFRKCCNRGLP
jgi:DNA-directed RNA polymerase subunit beta'